MALGGLGTWALFSLAVETTPAVKVIRTLYRGQVIQAGDLAVVAVGRSLDVPVVPASELEKVLGQAALIDLPAGTLLVDRSYGTPELATGYARVGLRLESGRLPVANLRPGARLVAVAVPGASKGTDAESLPASVEATLASAPTQAVDGSHLVELNVRISDAEKVVRWGAAKQVALYQKADR